MTEAPAWRQAHNRLALFQQPGRTARLSPGLMLARGVVLALAWHERVRQRRRLMRLDERALNDIGVRPDEAERECCSPFWRPFRPASMGL